MKRKSLVLGVRELPLRRVGRLAWYAALQSQKVFRHLGSQPQSRIRWDEFGNKLRAFLAFEYADLHLGIFRNPRPSLSQLIDQAKMVEPELSPFTVEGIGYHRAKAALRDNTRPDKVHLLEMFVDAPQGSLGVLHAGAGLALAESWLELTDEHSIQQAASLRQFTGICRQNSLPGYEGILLEALGFVTQTLYPNLIEVIDQALSEDKEALAYFWHGAGRGAYFAPANASPFRSAPWRVLEMCRAAPHRVAQENSMAGLAWALTLINLGEPEIMATFLKHHGADLTNDDAFTNGVRSAIAVWGQVFPGDTRIDAFLRYKSAYRDLIAQDVWRRLVEQPFAEALRDGLRERPEKWFRYAAM